MRDGKKLEINNQKEADGILKDLDGASPTPSKASRRAKSGVRLRRRLSRLRLQQEASRKLGFNAKRAMLVAQQLYEGVDVAGEGHVGLDHVHENGQHPRRR